MEILSTNKYKARQKHRCGYCNGIIEIGEEYESSFIVDGGSNWVWKNHLSCSELVTKTNMFLKNDKEPISDFDFMWCIADEFEKLFPNLDVNRTTPQERLNKVKEHYNL